MENPSIACPVCTLFLREGVTLQAHLDTHPKDQVIEALMRISSELSAAQVSATPTSNSSYAPVQSLTNSNSFMQQSAQAVLNINPQSQMTTAVTYQHFVTSNGSTVMPQYIQIPTIMNPSSSSIPIMSNSVNIVPSPTVNYSHTTYNPSQTTYNPSQTTYNPLYNPYIPQPYPITQPIYTNLTSVSSNPEASNLSSAQNQSEALQQVNDLAKTRSVATSTDEDRDVTVKEKCKKVVVKQAPSRRKVKMLKLKADSNRVIDRTDSPVVQSPMRLRLIKPKVTSRTNSRIIPPPPLTLITSTTNNSLSRAATPPPPPLSKAPCFEVVNVDKGEDVTDSAPPSVLAEEPEIAFVDDQPKSKDPGSEALYNNIETEIKIFTESESQSECQKDPLGIDVGENPNGGGEDVEQEGEENRGKIFQMLDEDTKIDISAAAITQDIPKEVSIENIEKDRDDSDIFFQEENILLGDVPDKDSPDLMAPSAAEKSPITREKIDKMYEFHSEDDDSQFPSKQLPRSYTDLQPAKCTVYQGISPFPNLKNYMEVAGIKIFFNSSGTNIPFDSVVKPTNGHNSVMKSENQPTNPSVIQRAPGEADSKGDITLRETYRATTSQSDIHLELADLSPLGLNIQTDESMPARGELSEQESLGAENSSWNLFHENSTNGEWRNEKKTPEEWRNETPQPVSVIIYKDNKPVKTFKCSTCNEVFSCPKERRVHKNTVHLRRAEKRPSSKKPKTYVCNFCTEVFTNMRERKSHVFQTHQDDAKVKRSDKIKEENVVKIEEIFPRDDRVKYCSRCRLFFEGLKKMREHLRLVHGEIRFKCEVCSTCFDEEQEYNEHLIVHPLACEKCGKTFNKRASLKLHLKRHLAVKPYGCSLCPKSFITRQKLEEHLNGHSGKKPLKCALCDKTFSRYSNLIQHRNLQHLNLKRKKLRDFVCRCGEVFHSPRKLEWHKEVHDSKPKPCPFCSQKFIHSVSVTRHIRKTHLPNYLPGENREFDNVQCPICEKVYLRTSLGVHMRVHSGEKPYPCKICNKSFTTKWNLELHNWTHQSRSNKPFKCTVCKSAFFREQDFVAHVNSHRNYKPFTCNVCGQRFVRKYSCLRHQGEHRKSKQYVCGVIGCAKSFHRDYYLRDHMKVHTGVRPHTCHICGKASSTKSNHNKHVRIHDTREPVNTEH